MRRTMRQYLIRVQSAIAVNSHMMILMKVTMKIYMKIFRKEGAGAHTAPALHKLNVKMYVI